MIAPLADTVALVLTLCALLIAVGAFFRQRRATRLEEQARRRLEAVFDATGFGVIEIDLSGSIRYANSLAAEILGFTAERLVGHDKHALLHRAEDAEDDGSRVCPLRAALQEARPYFGHDSFRRSDGTRIPIVVSTAPLGPPDGGAIVAFRDRSQDLARESESNERFEMISHELRSPLTSIVGFSRRLDRAVDQGRLTASEDQAEEIALLAREAERMRDTVMVLLGLARIDTGRIDVAPAPTELRSLIEEEVARVQRSVPQLDVTIHGDGEATVDTDDRIVAQVLNALLDNAAKHAGPAPHVEIEIVEEQSSTVIVVTDHGPGVPPELRESMFARFTRGPSEGSRRGLGLGLHIAKQVAYAAGAELTFDGEYDGGARFRLRIPKQYERREAPLQRWSW